MWHVCTKPKIKFRVTYNHNSSSQRNKPRATQLTAAVLGGHGRERAPLHVSVSPSSDNESEHLTKPDKRPRPFATASQMFGRMPCYLSVVNADLTSRRALRLCQDREHTAVRLWSLDLLNLVGIIRYLHHAQKFLAVDSLGTTQTDRQYCNHKDGAAKPMSVIHVLNTRSVIKQMGVNRAVGVRNIAKGVTQ